MEYMIKIHALAWLKLFCFMIEIGEGTKISNKCDYRCKLMENIGEALDLLRFI
jgi:hypothetical protein